MSVPVLATASLLAVALAAVRAEPAPTPAGDKPAAPAAPAEKPAAEKPTPPAPPGPQEAVKTALKVGDKAPEFALPDHQGKTVKLSELLAKGPVVVTWYRGGWCPYCNRALRALVAVEPDMRGLSTTLVAITPEKPDHAAATAKSDELTFPVLSDTRSAVARAYGVSYKIPAKTIETLRKYDIDLAARQGDVADELPLTVTYVIDTDRTIRYAFVDADYSKRADPADVLAALRKLKPAK